MPGQRGPDTRVEAGARPAPLSRSEYTRRAAIFLALAVAVFVLWRVAAILLLGFGGALFAVLIRAGGRWVSRYTRIPTRWASMLVVVLALTLGGLGAWLAGDHISRQFDTMRIGLPEATERAQAGLQQSATGRAVMSILGSALDAKTWTSLAMSSAGTLLSLLADLVVVAFIAIYLAFSPDSYIHGFLELLPRRHRARASEVIDGCSEALRGWLLGQLVAMSFVGALTGFGLWLAGVPNAATLGILAGVLDFVPVLGPFVAAAPGVLFAYAAGGPQTAMYAALVYFVVQQVESSLVQPLAQKWAVELPPAIGLLALVVFTSLFGIIGALFAVPLALVIMVLVRMVYLNRDEPVPEKD